MLVNEFGKVMQIFGMVCVFIGAGMLLYCAFSKDGNDKY